MDSRLGEGTSRCQTVCPWAVRWADALGAVPGRPWDGIWHTGDVIGHTRDVLGRPVDGRIFPRTSTGQWTHYGRSKWISKTSRHYDGDFSVRQPVSVIKMAADDLVQKLTRPAILTILIWLLLYCLFYLIELLEKQMIDRLLQWRHNECDGVSITEVSIVCSTVGSGADQRKHQRYASLEFVRGIQVTGEFPAQKASIAKNVSIWWRHRAEPLPMCWSLMWFTSDNIGSFVI